MDRRRLYGALSVRGLYCVGLAQSTDRQRGIESERYAVHDDDFDHHIHANHHQHATEYEYASCYHHGVYRDPAHLSYSYNGPGDHNAEDHLQQYSSDEDRSGLSNGRRDRCRLSNGHRDAHIHGYGYFARHRDLYTDDHPHVDGNFHANSNVDANRNAHRSTMNNFFRKYVHYFLITGGAMLITLSSLMVGQFTASIIFGTEITRQTVSMAGWFMLLAPAFLAWIDDEEVRA